MNRYQALDFARESTPWGQLGNEALDTHVHADIRSGPAVAKQADAPVFMRPDGSSVPNAFSLNLALLAPDIVEAAVASNEPASLSVARLRQGVPTRWEEQREMLMRGREKR